MYNSTRKTISTWSVATLGKRYRIHFGINSNVAELDYTGRQVAGFCFLPMGGLVAGDVMLAQKIALETNEKEALSVAKRFSLSDE